MKQFIFGAMVLASTTNAFVYKGITGLKAPKPIETHANSQKSYKHLHRELVEDTHLISLEYEAKTIANLITVHEDTNVKYVRCGMDEDDMMLTIATADGLDATWVEGSKLTGICHDTGLPFHRQLVSITKGNKEKEFDVQTQDVHFSSLFEDLEFKLTYELPGYEDLLTSSSNHHDTRNLRSGTDYTVEDEEEDQGSLLFSSILEPLNSNIAMAPTRTSRAHRARRRLGLWNTIKEDTIDVFRDTIASDMVVHDDGDDHGEVNTSINDEYEILKKRQAIDIPGINVPTLPTLDDWEVKKSWVLPGSMEFNYDFKTEKPKQRQIGIGGHNWLVCDECHLHLGAAVDLHMKFSRTGRPEYIRAGIRAQAGGRINLLINDPEVTEDIDMVTGQWIQLQNEKLTNEFSFMLGPIPVTLDILYRIMGSTKADTTMVANLKGGFDIGAKFESAVEWSGSDEGWKRLEPLKDWHFSAVKPEWNFTLPEDGEDSAHIRVGIAPVIVLELWKTVPFVFSPHPFVGFNLKTNGTDPEDGVSCDDSDEYELIGGLNFGIVVDDLVAPGDLEVIGGKKLLDGKVFGSWNVLPFTGDYFSKCGKLCHGCGAEYEVNKKEMIYHAASQGGVAFVDNDPDELDYLETVAAEQVDEGDEDPAFEFPGFLVFVIVLAILLTITVVAMNKHPKTKHMIPDWVEMSKTKLKTATSSKKAPYSPMFPPKPPNSRKFPAKPPNSRKFPAKPPNSRKFPAKPPNSRKFPAKPPKSRKGPPIPPRNRKGPPILAPRPAIPSNVANLRAKFESGTNTKNPLHYY